MIETDNHSDPRSLLRTNPVKYLLWWLCFGFCFGVAFIHLLFPCGVGAFSNLLEGVFINESLYTLAAGLVAGLLTSLLAYPVVKRRLHIPAKRGITDWLIILVPTLFAFSIGAFGALIFGFVLYAMFFPVYIGN